MVWEWPCPLSKEGRRGKTLPRWRRYTEVMLNRNWPLQLELRKQRAKGEKLEGGREGERGRGREGERYFSSNKKRAT